MRRTITIGTACTLYRQYNMQDTYIDFEDYLIDIWSYTPIQAMIIRLLAMKCNIKEVEL